MMFIEILNIYLNFSFIKCVDNSILHYYYWL